MPGVGVEKVGLLLRTRMDQKLGHKTFLMVFNSGRLTFLGLLCQNPTRAQKFECCEINFFLERVKAINYC